EKNIAGICREVLGYAEIDVNDNFFELGADSILLMRIHSELDSHYPGALTVADMFEHSSISKLAEYLIKLDTSQSPQETFIKQEERPVDSHVATDGDVAIIGMSLRLPMADTSDDYWRAIQTGLDHGSGFPEARRKD